MNVNYNSKLLHTVGTVLIWLSALQFVLVHYKWLVLGADLQIGWLSMPTTFALVGLVLCVISKCMKRIEEKVFSNKE